MKQTSNKIENLDTVSVSCLPFLSKGRTLQSLAGLLENAEVLPIYMIKQSYNNSNRLKQFLINHAPLIVRSSCSQEDTHNSSAAGKFLTIDNISSDAKLAEAINQVFASYPATDTSHKEET